jgi:hypothetical protein
VLSLVIYMFYYSRGMEYQGVLFITVSEYAATSLIKMIMLILVSTFGQGLNIRSQVMNNGQFLIQGLDDNNMRVFEILIGDKTPEILCLSDCDQSYMHMEDDDDESALSTDDKQITPYLNAIKEGDIDVQNLVIMSNMLGHKSSNKNTDSLPTGDGIESDLVAKF